MKYLNKLSKYMAYSQNFEKEHVKLNKHGFLDIFPATTDPIPKYNPLFVPHLCEFVNDTSKPIKIIMGPYGSGKTSCIINTILRDAVLSPLCDNGSRKYKIALIRNTAAQLETTTLSTWLFWTRGLPEPHRNKKPQLIYSYHFNDGKGEIYLDALFLALDREADISKLDSLELTSAYFNELRHIPHKIFDTIQSRIGRYPSKSEFFRQFDEEFGEYSDEEKMMLFQKWRPFEPTVYADTNAPKNRHWIAELEKNHDLKKVKVYHQPPALIKNTNGEYIINKEADNLVFEGEQYYLDMIDRGEEFIKVYAQGKYGTVVDGKSVFPYYNDELHSADDITLIPEEIVYLGCDYGIICPAILIAQFINGQIRFVKEFVGEYESIKDIARGYVIPFLNLYCRGMPLEIIGDPANTSGGREQLLEVNLEAQPALTNKIETRIAYVNNALNELIAGKPRILVSKQGCPTLREGFLGEYHYRRLKVIGEDKYVDHPNKTHPYSDIHDAAQYIVMKILDDEGIKLNSDFSSFNSKYHDKDKSIVTGY